MACAIHLGYKDKIDYKYMHDFPRERWTINDFFVFLQDKPKFSVDGTVGSHIAGIRCSYNGSPEPGVSSV